MNKYMIRGGRELYGEITVSGANRMGPVSFQALKFLMCNWVNICAFSAASWVR